jgi:hypothetical protein
MNQLGFAHLPCLGSNNLPIAPKKKKKSHPEPAAAPKYASVFFSSNIKSARVLHTHVTNCSCARTPKKTTVRDGTHVTRVLSNMVTCPADCKTNQKRIQLFNSMSLTGGLCLH